MINSLYQKLTFFLEKAVSSRLIVVLLLYISILSFFNKSIFYLLNSVFVQPLFSSFGVSIFNDILLLILSALLAKRSFKYLSFKFLFYSSVLIFIFYFIQRFYENWIFYNSYILDGIKLWDIPLITLMVTTFLVYLKKESEIKAVEYGGLGFLEDNPIWTDEQDSFSRKIMAKEIAEKILSTKNTKSFAIGVLGEYGSGKTSFIRLIKNSLIESEVEIIAFNPWSSENASNIQKDFFDLLSEKLTTLNPKLSSLIYIYSRKLKRIDEFSTSLVNRFTFLNSTFNKPNSKNTYEQINDMIAATGKKIIVIIDDLDRLYNDEIMEVLRLIRNTGDFSNVFYIVAYDKAYLLEAIKTLNKKGSATYLDKIFQLEIPLPKRDEDDLINILKKYISEIVDKSDLELFEDRIISYGIKNPYEYSYENVFRNSRDIVKFMNGFQISYGLMKEEVDFESLFILELIKSRFPVVYDLIYERNKSFLYLKPAISSHQEYYCIRYFEKEKGDRKGITQLYRHLTEAGELETFDIELIDSLFRKLFPGGEYGLPQAKNSISYPLFFQTYFKYRLSSYDLSEKVFSNAFHLGGNQLYEFIDSCVSKNLDKSLLTRILQEKPKDKKTFKTIINALFNLGPKYVAKTSTTSFEYESLRRLITDYDGNIVKDFYDGKEEDYRYFITSLFNSAQPPFLFENQLIYDIKHFKSSFIIPENELITYQVNYFEKYLDTYGFDNNAAWILFGIRHEYTEPAPEPNTVYKKWCLEELVIPVVKKYIGKNDMKQFLISSIQRDMRDKSLATIVPQIVEMFESPEELQTIIQDNPFLEAEVKSEYLKFFDECVKVSFAHYVNFKFETELIGD